MFFLFKAGQSLLLQEDQEKMCSISEICHPKIGDIQCCDKSFNLGDKILSSGTDDGNKEVNIVLNKFTPKLVGYKKVSYIDICYNHLKLLTNNHISLRLKTCAIIQPN